MNASVTELVVVMLLIPAAAVTLGVLYFLRIRVERPPVGVYTLRDIAVMMAVVVVLPVIYLHLPSFVVAAVLCLMTVMVAHFTLAPLLPRPFPLLLAVVAVAADLVLFFAFDGADFQMAATVWNDVLMLALVIGVCNLYAQSGMKTRDVAVFAAMLAAYDIIATLALPTMAELMRKVVELPFAPVFAAGPGSDSVVIGLGDVIMLLLWTLVSIKGYGSAAGWLAGLTALVVTTALVVGIETGIITGIFPVMMLAGPIMVVEYLVLRRIHGPERTTAAYQGSTQGEPAENDAAVVTALEWLTDRHPGNAKDSYYVGVHGSEVLGVGSTPGQARQNARVARADVVPVIGLVTDASLLDGGDAVPVGESAPAG